MRAPGLTYMRLPLFTWTTFVASALILFAFPPRGGNANKMSADATNVVHVNSGNLIYVKPGALILIIVARKLIPAISVPKPDI